MLGKGGNLTTCCSELLSFFLAQEVIGIPRQVFILAVQPKQHLRRFSQSSNITNHIGRTTFRYLQRIAHRTIDLQHQLFNFFKDHRVSARMQSGCQRREISFQHAKLRHSLHGHILKRILPRNPLLKQFDIGYKGCLFNAFRIIFADGREERHFFSLSNGFRLRRVIALFAQKIEGFDDFVPVISQLAIFPHFEIAKSSRGK